MVDACDVLSIEKPVLQAAMGAVARHDLVVAVSRAGGLGTLGYLPPQAFARELSRIEDSLEGRAFAANLLLPIIAKAHVDACLSSRVPIVTLFYGFDQGIVDALTDAGKIVLFQIGSLEEARRVFHSGAHGVVVQGVEAGGHVRGTDRLADLLPRVKEAFPDRLVIGAGGIHDAATAADCRRLGADAVSSGTRFLASPEAAAHPAYKERLVEASHTVMTNLFGAGWRDPHRVIPNAAVERWCSTGGREPAWLALVHRAMRLAARLSASDGGAALTARQRLSLPIYTPACLTPEMDPDLVEVTALYAGECVQHIHDLQDAATTVDALA